MQTYRLVIGPDGKVKIPDGTPGRTVTVLLDEVASASAPELSESVAAMSGKERQQLKREFLERGRRVREHGESGIAVDHDAELYGDDGLPR